MYLAYFIRPFYKMMLKKKITLIDMQSVVCVRENMVHCVVTIVTPLLYRMQNFTTVFVIYWKMIQNLSVCSLVLLKNFLGR